MNNKGQAQYVVGFLFLVIAIMGFFLWRQPEFAATIMAATDFFNAVKYWVLGALVVGFLWKLGVFRVLFGR